MNITRINTKNLLKFENVEIDELTVEDEEKAVTIANAESGYNFMLALLSIACTFDGQKYPMEDLKRLSRSDFLQLMQALTGKSPQDLEKTLSDSQGTQNSTTQA